MSKMIAESIVKDLDYWKEKIVLYDVEETLGTHHGFYEKGIHSHSDAVKNMNNYVEKLLKLKNNNKNEKILDMGCGFGGTILYLAKKYQNKEFTGIDVSPEEIKIAKEYAKKKHTPKNVKFIVGNFNDTYFPSDYFDAILAVESLSYNRNKKEILKEINRILKPGGKLIIIDGFDTGVKINGFIKKMYDIYNKDRNKRFFYENDWRRKNIFKKIENIPSLEYIEKIISDLKDCNFKDINVNNISKKISMSSNRIWFLYIISHFQKRSKSITKKIPKKSFWDLMIVIISRFISDLKSTDIYCSITTIKS